MKIVDIYDMKTKLLFYTIIILESVETKQIECQTVVLTKHMQNKRPLNKGPFLANIPLQHMVQNYEEVETKEISHAPDNSTLNRVCPYIFIYYKIIHTIFYRPDDITKKSTYFCLILDVKKNCFKLICYYR